MYSDVFVKPRPGCWELETYHYSRPMSRWSQIVFYRDGFKRGFADGFKHYGVPLEPLDVEFVQGFFYQCLRPIGAPPEPKGLPPKFIFKLLHVVHPELRARARRAAQVWREKIWRADFDRWSTEMKPRLLKTIAELRAVDVAALDDHALLAHHDACVQAIQDSLYAHQRLSSAVLLPIGDFMWQAQQWTNASMTEILACFKGFSPSSLGAPAELDAAAAAIAADANARATLNSSRGAEEIVASLMSSPAVKAWLDVVGDSILTGIDVADSTVREVPEMIVKALRTALLPRSEAAAKATADALRARVPAAHQREFDELLEEARFMWPLRDDRTVHTDYPLIGLSRRMLLEVGRRLERRGLLERFDHAVELLPQELHAKLKDGGGPQKSDLAAAARWRETKTIADAPQTLGPPAPPPPPMEWMPAGFARSMRATNVFLGSLFYAPKSAATAHKTVRGLPVSAGVVEGPARIVSGPKDFARVQQGDVLVSRTTTPTYNILLPLLAGVVTDRGGLLSHTAVVAREYGLPAVVGTHDATTIIPDGARIRIDGNTGEVHVLESALGSAA